MTRRELRGLLDTLRATGVQYFKSADVEIAFQGQPDAAAPVGLSNQPPSPKERDTAAHGAGERTAGAPLGIYEALKEELGWQALGQRAEATD